MSTAVGSFDSNWIILRLPTSLDELNNDNQDLEMSKLYCSIREICWDVNSQGAWILIAVYLRA